MDKEIELGRPLLDLDGNPIGSTYDCIMYSNGQPVTDGQGNYVIVKNVVDKKNTLTLGQMIVESLMFATHFTDKERVDAYELANIIIPWRRKETPAIEGAPEETGPVNIGCMPLSELPNPAQNIVMIQESIKKRYPTPIVCVQACKMLDEVLT